MKGGHYGVFAGDNVRKLGDKRMESGGVTFSRPFTGS